MKKLVIALASALLLLPAASKAQSNLPYMNAQLPRQERIEDLLSRLTVEEKIGMMMNGAKGVERLGIPDYNWWNEALHGVGRAGLATVFPQAIGLAATWDVEGELETFTVVSDEARAKYNDAISRGEHKQYYGLTFWTPNINIFRDPRWGRGQETYGEDPFLTSMMGAACVNGLQGNDKNYYKLHACAKHYAVHSGPEPLRHKFDIEVSPVDMWETYLPAFRKLVVDAGVREVMGAYNSYAGDPCCGSELLLEDILRGRWQYSGLVVSDCGAIDDFYRANAHAVYPDAASASAKAVLTGTDIECGRSYNALKDALDKDLLKEADIDVCIRRILNGMFELGMFDPESLVPWSNLPIEIVDSQAHKDQALKMARESIVLLKNNGVLPIMANSVGKIAVVGPNADNAKMLLGNYNGTPSSSVTILQGIRNAYPNAEVSFERGCDLVEGYVSLTNIERMIVQMLENGEDPNDPAPADYEGVSIEQRRQMQAQRERMMAQIKNIDINSIPRPIPAENYTDEALAALAARAAESDVIFFVGGISPEIEGEEMRVQLDGFAGGDRTKIELPEIQSKMLKALHATGKPVVFVLCTGAAIALAENEADYDALVCAWYGGQAAGTAVGDVVSGVVSPSGRLPITFYKSTSQLPDFEDYDMAGRTYRYMTEAPLYQFGFGLSYANFKYGKAKLSAKKIKAGESVTVKVKVTNKSKVDSDEIVQVYVKRLGDAAAPIKDLKGFKRVSLKAGETKVVEIELPASSFEYYSEADGDLAVKTGKYKILCGKSSADKDLKALKLRLI